MIDGVQYPNQITAVYRLADAIAAAVTAKRGEERAVGIAIRAEMKLHDKPVLAVKLAKRYENRAEEAQIRLVGNGFSCKHGAEGFGGFLLTCDAVGKIGNAHIGKDAASFLEG